jgi:hypothetical protein
MGVFKMSEAKYRIQYAEQHRFAQWSEWRTLDVPITEPLVLGIHVNEQCSKEELAELMQCNIK